MQTEAQECLHYQFAHQFPVCTCGSSCSCGCVFSQVLPFTLCWSSTRLRI